MKRLWENELSVSSTGSFSLEQNRDVLWYIEPFAFQYPRLDRFLWNLFVVVEKEIDTSLSVSSTGSFSLEPAPNKRARVMSSILSVSSTGSFSLEPNQRAWASLTHSVFQYPRLDRFLWNILVYLAALVTQHLSVSSTGSFSLEHPHSEPAAAPQTLSVSSTGSFSLELAIARKIAKDGTPFSILDWIVFSGTRLAYNGNGNHQDFQYPRLDRFLWNNQYDHGKYSAANLSVSSTGSFSLEPGGGQYQSRQRPSFSILDWIVFSGT